jgi:hypothetical protein
MVEMVRSIPDEIRAIWQNLSPQMQGHIKTFGLELSLDAPDFTPEQWRNLSPQMQGHIKARKSMEEETRRNSEQLWKKLISSL